MDPSIKPKSYKLHEDAAPVLRKMVDGWSTIDRDSERLRNFRFVRNLGSETLKNEGAIRVDEGYFPIKLIDQNIRREAPQYIDYLTKSPRAVIFKNVDGTSVVQSETIEADFTNKVRYENWEKPFLQMIDGTQFLGWSSMEIVLDINKPGNFAFEYIPHENLIFPQEALSINEQELIMRRIEMTEFRLNQNIKEFEFNEDEVKNLVKRSPDKTDVNGLNLQHSVYKVFFKEDNIVYVAYWARYGKEWLREPKPLFLGRADFSQGLQQTGVTETGQPIVGYPDLLETEYPIKSFFYILAEDQKLVLTKGRGMLDEEIQMAVSAVQSGYVNGICRASNIYAAPANVNQSKIGTFAEPKQTNVVLKNGVVYDQPMNFFHTPYPESQVGEALDQILQINQRETNQINYSVVGAPITKTATEVSAAQAEASKLSSVQVTQASIAFREIFSLAWLIYQNRVAQGKIKLVNPALEQFFFTRTETGQVSLKSYTLRPAGDVDIIQRGQKLDRQMKFWPVVQTTPLAMTYLMDMLQTAFPEESIKYNQILRQQKVDLTNKLAQLVNELATDENGQVRPELQGMEQQLQQIGAQVNQMNGVQ